MVACSRKDNGFISRNLHAVGTEYNILYNGELALDEGIKSLEDSYQDNFWDVLPVERLEVTDQVKLSTEKATNPNFERAEEKAVKAVQKHSMLIKDQEYNPQIDDAYLLLGKARYYDQNYVPAQEAFNYILQNMSNGDKRRLARVWRERTNMRLDNNETAIRNLQKLLEEDQKEFKREDLAITNATLAQAFLNMKQTDSAIKYMRLAAKQTRNNDSKARYTFISGQLFALAGKRDSAFMQYDDIIKMHRSIPRNYYVHAYIEKIKLFDTITDSKDELFKTITKLEENRENRPWLDAIYSRKAIYYQSIDSSRLATSFFNKSLRTSGQDKYLRGNTYAALGDITFNAAKYETAGKYYDSAVAYYKDRTKEQRLTRKKSENLVDVILYEKQRRSADSIFTVLALSPDERIAYYQSHIENLKAEEEKQLEKAERAAEIESQNENAFQNIANSRTPGTNNGAITGPPSLGNMPPSGVNDIVDFPATPAAVIPSTPNIASSNASSFYFYNPQTVERGRKDFRAKWGKRNLEDNWKFKNAGFNTTNAVVNDDNLSSENGIVAGETLREDFTVDYYINKLPLGILEQDSIRNTRDFAYFQLGVIYKEKFKRNDLAVDRFTTLVDRKPVEKLLLPSLYNLYLINNENNAFAKAEQVKTRIIADYPTTRYAQILNNPEKKLDDESSPVAVYGRIYKDYEKQQYEQVITDVEKYSVIFQGDEIVPKMELLKAYASGRLYGYEDYKRGLDYVALNFPNSETGKGAQELVAKAESLNIPTVFYPEDKQDEFKLIYRMQANDSLGIASLKKTLESGIAKQNFAFKVSTDIYSPTETLVVVHGLKSNLSATTLGVYMATPENKFDIKKAFIPIASENYKIVQIYKKLDDYEKGTAKTP